MFKLTFYYKRTGDANATNFVNVKRCNTAKLTEAQERTINKTMSTSNNFSFLENDVLNTNGDLDNPKSDEAKTKEPSHDKPNTIVIYLSHKAEIYEKSETLYSP